MDVDKGKDIFGAGAQFSLKSCFRPNFDRKIAVFFQDLFLWTKLLSWTSIMEMKMSLLQIT
jgi:hypothetical protein